jgi:hypothetical protein
MTQGHRSGKRENTTQLPTHLSHGKKTCRWYHLEIFDTGSFALARTTRPNEFTRAPSNDPPERFCMGARTTETKRQGRAGKTSCTNVHKANLGSQLSIFDTGSFARARPRPNDPPERVHTGALKRPARTTETKRQGRAGQTSCTNVHKANLGSQLSIFDTGSFARARPRPNDPPERVHTGALKRPARTTETKRSDKGEPGKRAARTCTKPTSGHNLAFLIRARSPGRPNDLARTSSHGRPQTTRPNDRNEATRESRANELHERAQSQPRVTT